MTPARADRLMMLTIALILLLPGVGWADTVGTYTKEDGSVCKQRWSDTNAFSEDCVKPISRIIGQEERACYWWFDKDDGLQMEGPGCKRFLLERANTFSPVLKNNCTYETVDHNLVSYDCEHPPVRICLDQMREAMRMMDRLLSFNLHWQSPLIGKDSLKTYGYNELKTWNQTIKDCVEDKP